MPRTRLALVSLAGLFATATALAQEKDPGDAIKGIWAVESMTFNGTRVPDDPTAGPKLTAFDGKQYVQRQGQTIIEEGAYEVDPTKTPRAIDFVIKKGRDAGKRQLGIFEVEDGRLRVCLAEPGSTKRPKSFDASGSLLVVNARFRP